MRDVLELDNPMTRRRRLLFGLGLIALGLAAVPFDGTVRDFLWTRRVGGDVKRELEFLQQFGAISSIVLISLVILLLDPADARLKWRRIADLAGVAALNGLIGNFLKMFLGRPRPLFDDPAHLLGPLGRYPVERDGAVVLMSAWEVGTKGVSDLWSMPSSHAMAGAGLAFALSALYPRLRPLCVGLACVVCAARVLLNAHYVSDVMVGAALGWMIAAFAMRREVGSRLFALIVPGLRAADRQGI
ncbi:MAG TPA: phosphatase PAP2 family protein [Phycisphaerales bacterium]